METNDNVRVEFGDILLNKLFGDLWLVINDKQVFCIGKDHLEEIENLIGFIKVGKLHDTSFLKGEVV